MRPLKSLTFEAFRDLLASVFKQIPDQRDPTRITWEMPAALMSAFAMFFFQHPNLLEYQRRMKKKSGRSNLERVFQVEDLTSDTQMREILDGAPIEPLRSVLPEVFERMRRVGWTLKFATEVEWQKYYTVVLDGSEYFHSTKIECPGCLRRKSVKGEVNFQGEESPCPTAERRAFKEMGAFSILCPFAHLSEVELDTSHAKPLYSAVMAR